MRTQTARKPGLGAFLLTATFYPLMAVWVLGGVASAPLLIAALWAATGWDLGRVVRFWIKVHGKGLLAIVSPFVRLRTEGVEGIPWPCILVANHLSFVDGYCMAALPFFDLTFVVGAWPFRMVWYRPFMRLARYIDAENTGWEDAVSHCREAASKGGSMLFFPEGHRSRDRRLQPFHSGGFRMAIETGLPLVPLCISGTDVFLPPGSYWLHPARIRLKALAAVYPGEFRGPGGPARMGRAVRARMERAIETMEAAPCP
jgi:1-acyl-sn-glycerol-3-phosphate acyltransferase